MSDSKDPAEIVDVTFPYANEIGAATISVPVVSVAVVNGTDGAVALMLSGAPATSGSDVLQRVRNGVNAVDYKFRCEATLSDGRKLVRTLDLPVKTR